MLETRNSTSHEYNMDKIDKKLEDIAYKYFDELTLFAENLKDFNDWFWTTAKNYWWTDYLF